jgi:hypothetical protein
LAKSESLCIGGEIVKLFIYFGKQHDSCSKKLDMDLPYTSEILLLCIYPKEVDARSWTYICTIHSSIFIIAKK